MTKTRIGIIAVVVAIGVGGVTWVVAQGPQEEDRPAMIVRNGSLIIENAGGSLEWLYADGSTLTPNQPLGKRVINADVTVYQDQTKKKVTCELKAALRFRIRYQEPGDSEDIHVITNGPRPLIFPNDVVSRSTDKKQLTRGSTGKGAILVFKNNEKKDEHGVKTCAVPKDHVLEITFNHPPSRR